MYVVISFFECVSCVMCLIKELLCVGEYQEFKVYYLEVLINYEVDVYNVCGVEGFFFFGFYWIFNYFFF